MPSLIQKHQEKVIVNQLKEFYSIFSQALLLAQNEQGMFNNKQIYIYDYIKPYLKLQKDCGTKQGCFADTVVKTLDGEDWVNLDTYTGYHKFILSNGASVQLFSGWSNSDSGTAEIRVDVNGFKGPNTLGRDIFSFGLKSGKLVPSGVAGLVGVGAFETRCNVKNKVDYNGSSCTAWVLYNENMDYLHCDDLNWQGKHKCD